VPAPVKPLPHEDIAHVFAHTRALWEEARGQRFFITGGTGFFGIWLLESFVYINDALRLGMSATVLTRDPRSFASKAPHLVGRADLEFIPGDIRNFVFPAGKFAYIVHAAAELGVKPNDGSLQEVLEVMIDGTRRVLDFAAQCSVKKLLLASSGAVYGKQPFELARIPEDYTGAPDPLVPGSAYGEGKRMSEHFCAIHALRHSYELKIARCFAFVGPHLPLDSHFAIGNFIRDALAGGPIRVNGDGTPLRSYLYAADLTVCLWTLLFSARSHRAYNVGSSEALSIAEVARSVSKLSLNPLQVQVAGDGEGGERPIRYIPDTSRAEQELGIGRKVQFPCALKKTFLWYQLLQ
jgi:nucleoside-diphosphate-sugar epimerase